MKALKSNLGNISVTKEDRGKIAIHVFFLKAKGTSHAQRMISLKLGQQQLPLKELILDIIINKTSRDLRRIFAKKLYLVQIYRHVQLHWSDGTSDLRSYQFIYLGFFQVNWNKRGSQYNSLEWSYIAILWGPSTEINFIDWLNNLTKHKHKSFYSHYIWEVIIIEIWFNNV